eukprot:TRINITY_DN792_c0_g1_i2.p2 TRINITY_DN792_c0_g1~~TRINITY_DN792_c0_g1_i2.p2  ORF type:complete len:200 (+),score=20.74 TRINITY_DN792_c0_g1_i2:332-931(+)
MVGITYEYAAKQNIISFKGMKPLNTPKRKAVTAYSLFKEEWNKTEEIKSKEDCKKVWEALSKEEKEVYINKYDEMRESQKPAHSIVKSYNVTKVKAILDDYNAKNPDNMIKLTMDDKMYNGLAKIAVILYCLILQGIFFAELHNDIVNNVGAKIGNEAIDSILDTLDGERYKFVHGKIYVLIISQRWLSTMTWLLSYQR